MAEETDTATNLEPGVPRVDLVATGGEDWIRILRSLPPETRAALRAGEAWAVEAKDEAARRFAAGEYPTDPFVGYTDLVRGWDR